VRPQADYGQGVGGFVGDHFSMGYRGIAKEKPACNQGIQISSRVVEFFADHTAQSSFERLVCFSDVLPQRIVDQ
jgi:hypothetical protein